MDTIVPVESESEDGGEPTIAHRTRSHLRIDDFVPNDNLDFPDVDMNLYQNPDSEGDPVYRTFLNECYGTEIVADTNTEDNDPEYVYNDDIFSHGWRYDISEVIEQLNETPNEPENEPCQNDNQESLPRSSVFAIESQPIQKSPLKSFRRRLDMFDDPEFARVLNQQLRQHIQLLAQTYLLTKFTTNMKSEAEEAKTHLESYMKIFKNKSKPSNLLPTLELVKNMPMPQDIKSSIRSNWRPLPIPNSISTVIKENPHIFMYPSLLPKVAFSFLPEKLMPKKPKINFTLNEDKLLAYALNEFKSESSPHAFIASLLMTAKTKTQISNHIKNIKRSPGCDNNPIKLYSTSGKLPHIDLDSDSELLPHDSSDKMFIKIEDMVETNVKPKLDNELSSPVPVIDSPPTTEYHHVDSIHFISSDAQNETSNNDPADAQEESATPNTNDFNQSNFSQHDDLMNMDLDDLMAASTTISKSTCMIPNNSSENNRNIKNLKLRKSMLNLMSHNFLLSNNMNDLIICDFLRSSQKVLGERNYLHLLQLLADLMRRESREEGEDNTTVLVFDEISKFLRKVNAPVELQEKSVLFLDLNQATQCGCSENYLHWMRFFKFMQHIELYHDAGEAFEKKLARLIDALQKDDSHKIKLAIGNLVNKHPFLKREFESLSLTEKPHPSLFICDEDFDDITDPIAVFPEPHCRSESINSLCEVSDNSEDKIYKYEHFSSKVAKDELSYATQSCPCRCHQSSEVPNPDNGCLTQLLGQHCERCNLKFMKGRMYLVNKIKPILAEWSYSGTSQNDTETGSVNASPVLAHQNQVESVTNTQTSSKNMSHVNPTKKVKMSNSIETMSWSFEEDREILEFCRAKVEQNDESASFDTITFEELVNNSKVLNDDSVRRKKSAKEVADRFNHLMDMYKEESSDAL